jgi:CHAD domain-containing protein
MPLRKKLKHYFRKREKHLTVSLKELKRSFVPENFHRLRVEIKKIKALHTLISSFANKFDQDSSFNPYRIIFKEAGKVRELQLEEALLNKNKDPGFLKNYRVQLKELKLRQQVRFCQKINAGSLKDLKDSSHTVFSFLEKAKKDSLRAYIGKNRKKIKGLICKGRLLTNEVHQLRKRLKSLYYILTIRDTKSLKKELESMEKLTETIGEWHDKLVMSQRLQKAIHSAHIKAADAKTLSKLRTKLGEERKLLFQKINQEVNANCRL